MHKTVNIYPPYDCVIVDDDEDLGEFLHDCFQQLFGQYFVTKFFSNANEALEFARSNPIDLLISDLKMPDVYGDSLIRSVRSINPGTLAVICTGCPTVLAAMSARSDGILGFIEKPFDLDSLEKHLSPIVDLLNHWHESIHKRSRTA